VDHTAYRSLAHDLIFSYTELLPQWTLEMFMQHALPEYHEEAETIVREATAAQRGWTYECRIRRADGEIRWVWFSGSHYTNISGHKRVIGVVQDITERKQNEKALLESEARRKVVEAVGSERRRLFDVLESLPVMICLLTADYHVAFANRGYRKHFGVAGEKRCYEYRFGLTNRCEFCESYKMLETGQPQHWEFIDMDGRIIETYDLPFTDVDGSPMILKMILTSLSVKKQKKL
jgi:PAS domain-containing protein